MKEIGGFFDCNHVTIVNRFKEYGLKSRGHLGLTKPVNLSKSGLIYLYDQKQLSVEKIARIIGRSKGAIERKIKKYGVKTRGTANRIPYKYRKVDFDGSRSNQAYIIGFRLGDLNVYLRKQTIMVRCSTTIYAQIQLIRNLFKKYGGVHVSRAKRGTYEINCFLNQSFNFLVPKHRKIPAWIQNKKEYFFSFWTGYVDAEGYIDTKRRGFQVQTQQKEIIFDSYKCLNRYEISCNCPRLSRKAGSISKAGVRNNEDCWRINLYKRNEVEKFIFDYVELSKHAHKKKAAEHICAQLLSSSQKTSYISPIISG